MANLLKISISYYQRAYFMALLIKDHDDNTHSNYYRISVIDRNRKVFNTGLLKDTFNVYKSSGMKHYLIVNDVVQIHNNIRWYNYNENNDININNKLFPNDISNACYNIENSRYMKNKRIEDRIRKYLLIGNCYFMTFTFTNKVLESTSKNTRRLYISRYLKKHFKHYIANIDYGTQTEREHYHAIICNPTNTFLNWDYGFFNYKLIGNCTDDLKKLSKYLTKLKNHTKKDSTKNEKIIYSRDTI